MADNGVNLVQNSPEAGDSYPPGVLNRVQDALLQMLVAIDDVCQRNGIEYFIDGGTCLGALRHGGFIPWDDDADVGMSLENYLRFREVAPRCLPEGMSLRTCNNTDGFYYMWSRVCLDKTRAVTTTGRDSGRVDSIFVDVFPYVHLDAKNPQKHLRKTVAWQRLAYLHFLNYVDLPKTMHFRHVLQASCFVAHYTVAQLWSVPQMYEKFVAACRCDNPSGEWHDACIAYGKNQKTSNLFPTCRVTFAGNELSAPHDMVAYCEALYGDWQTLPPLGQRKTHAPLVLDFGDGINVMEGWHSGE